MCSHPVRTLKMQIGDFLKITIVIFYIVSLVPKIAPIEQMAQKNY